MAEEPRKAHVIENGESAFSVDITVSGFSIKGDEPVDAGGGNLGPAPYDTLLAASGECTAMTVRWQARQQNWPLDKVEVDLTHYKEGRTDHFTKAIKVYGNALTDEQRDKLDRNRGKMPCAKNTGGHAGDRDATCLVRSLSGFLRGFRVWPVHRQEHRNTQAKGNQHRQQCERIRIGQN